MRETRKWAIDDKMGARWARHKRDEQSMSEMPAKSLEKESEGGDRCVSSAGGRKTEKCVKSVL